MLAQTDKDVNLDFSKVEVLTAATLAKLVRLNRHLRVIGSRLVLRNVTDWVYEIFEVTGLTKVLTIRRGQRIDEKMKRNENVTRFLLCQPRPVRLPEPRRRHN